MTSSRKASVRCANRWRTGVGRVPPAVAGRPAEADDEVNHQAVAAGSARWLTTSHDLLAAAALTLNLWVQYFVRLEEMFPLSVRLVGFGVGPLVGGVLHEQQVRHRLAQLRDWN